MSPFADPIYARWFRRKHGRKAYVRHAADLWFLDEIERRYYGVFQYEGGRKV